MSDEKINISKSDYNFFLSVNPNKKDILKKKIKNEVSKLSIGNLIFLDDCFSAFKNNQTFEYLKESNEWKIVSSNLERNGYSIFRKKI
jgi:hypothetical protein